jgi:hypothetical protein
MECIAIDWSGAVTGEASKIWVARASGGALTALFAPGSRAATHEFLVTRQHDPSPCVVGLDFAFSVPKWWADAQRWSTVRDVWSAARADGERWLRECQPPFWGRPGMPRPHEVSHGLRETERTWAAAQRPKSVFQIGGAGAVGTGSIRGMPMLLALRDAGWAVWPFDAPARHTLIEIYPRLFTGAVVKRSAAAREAQLAVLQISGDGTFVQSMIASEDAFDAGVSAIAMSRLIASAPLAAVDDADARIEGRIWVPGAT